MTDELLATKESLRSAIQASAISDDDLEGSVLVGWVIVAEWMASDGKRWLSRIGAPADSTSTLPDWQREGYLHNALHSSEWSTWSSDEDGDG